MTHCPIRCPSSSGPARGTPKIWFFRSLAASLVHRKAFSRQTTPRHRTALPKNGRLPFICPRGLANGAEKYCKSCIDTLITVIPIYDRSIAKDLKIDRVSYDASAAAFVRYPLSIAIWQAKMCNERTNEGVYLGLWKNRHIVYLLNYIDYWYMNFVKSLN